MRPIKKSVVRVICFVLAALMGLSVLSVGAFAFLR